MTPDKSKKPLPTSSSMTFLEKPKSRQQWNYALKTVQATYLKIQWKQCLTLCAQLLCETTFSPIPLHAACLHFYAALSEEALARQMHNLSIAKVQSLERAKSCFEQAASALPKSLKSEDQNHDSRSSTISTSDIDDTKSLEDSASSVDGQSPIVGIQSPSTATLERSSPANSANKPLPLKICKAAGTGSSSFHDKRKFFEAKLNASTTSSPTSPALSSPVPRSPKIISPAPKTPITVTPSPLKDPPPKPSTPAAEPEPISSSPPSTPSSWQHNRAQDRYTEHLQDFTDMLAKHISFVDDQISKAQEAQAMRRIIRDTSFSAAAATAFADGDDEEARGMALRGRIASLKAGGWKRERFAPERYQDLCERALAEL